MYVYKMTRCQSRSAHHRLLGCRLSALRLPEDTKDPRDHTSITFTYVRNFRHFPKLQTLSDRVLSGFGAINKAYKSSLFSTSRIGSIFAGALF